MSTTTAPPSTTAVAERLGCSYRQLDHAVRVGYLTPVGAGEGSGVPREWSETEIRVAAVMFELEKAGFRLEVAAAIARKRVTKGSVSFELAEGVFVDVAIDGTE